jgi:TPR repeat protein
MRTISKLKPLILAISVLSSIPALSNDLELGIYQLNRGEFHQAIAQFAPLVAEGYSPAQYQMALVYQHGYGVAKDGMKALALFQLAAAQNYPDAQFELALLYGEGKLVKKDLKKAFEFTEKAAKKGLASAQFNLAVMYANSEGVKEDNFKASRWYQRAADQNYALAQYNLALLYSEGKGVEKSTQMSYVWNTIASWNGYPNAERSRLMDQRDLSKHKIEVGIEKANQIYNKIKAQQALKAKMADKKRLY